MEKYLKKNPHILYILCIIAVMIPGVYLMFVPKPPARDEEHAAEQQMGIILIGSMPFLMCCLFMVLNYNMFRHK